jgi:hypothetical protein
MTAVSSVRITPDSSTVSNNLGLIADLAGTWEGQGFNLIARPDFHDQAPLYLQLNQTHETLKVDPIGSSIPNRGFGMDDIELFGLTYLQKISDAPTGGALHIEPGIWVTQPATTYPPEQPPANPPGTTPPPDGQIVARMATIPHGNSVLAQGAATKFSGPPTLSNGGSQYAFSVFPSFNSTPFAVIPNSPLTLNAAGSSEQLTAPALPAPAPAPFPEYDLTQPDGPHNPRTPFGTTEPPLPGSIDGVAMQDVVNDPIRLLQAAIDRQVADGYTFEGVALNIATQRQVSFRPEANKPQGAPVTVDVSDAAGGTENILFLEGGEPAGALGPNAQTSLVYATFWITIVSHEHRQHFLQLQYAQMTVLNFGILNAPAGAPILGWPHISVATLRKSFF